MSKTSSELETGSLGARFSLHQRQLANGDVKQKHPSLTRYPWWLNPVSIILLSLISIYRNLIPDSIKKTCIYTPTCSLYAMHSIKKYGAIRGSWFAFQRIRRCNGALFSPGEDLP